jgi:molybdenum cofactor cytidylyltransferase
MIVAVVLAAGAGSRFGGAKVAATIAGTPVVRHVVDRLRKAGIQDVVVTAGEHVAAIRAALDGSGARIVSVEGNDGMSASLRAGLAALPSRCDAIVVALGDQPFIDTTVVAELITTWSSSNAAAVVPRYQGGVQGHPVLFDATMRRRLSLLTGDRGARDLLREMGDRVVWLDFDHPVPADIDTPADLDELQP